MISDDKMDFKPEKAIPTVESWLKEFEVNLETLQWRKLAEALERTG